MTVRPFDLVCQRLLERSGATGRNGSWRCPAHDDSSPSLSVSQTNDGTVLLHCHAGCTAADVLAALDLDLQDLFGKPKSNGHDRPEIVARYRYVDEDRQLLFEVVRYHPKAFKQRRPDGNGDWAWNLRGVRRVLYNLPHIITAKQQAKMIVVVEGEKDADAVMRAGEVATTCPQGAGKWKPEYTKTLAGHTGQIIVVADRDEPGLKHARNVAVDLRAAGCEVHLCQPATGKDVADHLGAGLTLEDLELLAIDEPAAAGKAQPDESEEFDDVPDVPGFVVLNDLRDWLAAHVAFQSPHHAPTVALWCAHTHALDLAASTPRIAFESPEPESGKTRTLELMECVCHRGRLVLQMSAASVYRWVEAIRPALLIDEIDAVFGPKASKDHEDLRALVNAGHRRGATVPRVDPNSMKVTEFSCFAPVALAGIAGALPDTMRSRSIRVPMRRRAPDETVKPFLEPVTRPEGEALAPAVGATVADGSATLLRTK